MAHEFGLASSIDLIPIVVQKDRKFDDPPAYPNPLGQIPTLLLEDGRAMFDSPVICAFLKQLAESRSGSAPCLADFDPQCREALADGILDICLRHKASGRIVNKSPTDYRADEVRQLRVEHVLTALGNLSKDWSDDVFDVGHAAIATALAYLDFRSLFGDWRSGRSDLAAWFAAAEQRPSMQYTQFIDTHSAALSA